MSIVWESRNAPFYTDGEDDRISFQRHDECMRRFRLTHTKVETIDSKCVKKVDWLTLVPLQKVKLTAYFQN